MYINLAKVAILHPSPDHQNMNCVASVLASPQRRLGSPWTMNPDGRDGGGGDACLIPPALRRSTHYVCT